MTQQEIAKQLGLSQGYVSKLFSGKAALSWDQCKRLSVFVSIPAADLKEASPEQLKSYLINNSNME